MSTVTYLPNSLILLIHLHLLNYHFSNKPEYGDNIFSSARGLRERTKTMEDISYFLVGRLERMKEGPKALFPTYPCTRPSDTVSFRTSLAKYLEQIRHGSIYASTLGKGPKQKERPTLSNGNPAVWWKDVVVRKSLLEECSGERFERLMLALSTHTLMKVSKSPPIPNFCQELIRQPQLYHSELSRLRTLRRQWEERALYLDHRAEKLEQLRTQLSSAGRSGRNFQSTSTQKIQELAKSKLNHIQSAMWTGEDGANALQLLLTLAGLSSSKPLQHAPSTLGSQPGDILILQSSPVAPLPVSAAHHLSQLKKFCRPIFRPTALLTEGKFEKPPLNPTKHCVHPYLQANATVHAALAGAVARLRLKNETLSRTVNNHLSSDVVPLPPLPSRLLHFEDKLLDRLADFVVEELGTPDLVAKLEDRIEEIRTGMLAPYPDTQDPLPERLPAVEPRVKPPTGIPQRIPPQSSATSREASKIISPNKRSPRKSIRFSMARQARPRASTFRVFSGGEEVAQLIDSTNDLPSDNENSDTEFDSFGTPGTRNKTPKSKPKINRIWTASTPGARPPSTLRNSGMASRESFPNFMEAAVSLPSLLSVEGFLGVDDKDEDGDEDEDEDGNAWYGADGARIGDQLATPRANGFHVEHSDEDTNNNIDEYEGAEYAEEWYEEEGSMSLNEILLSSRTSFVDLMGTQVVSLEDDDHAEDDSF